MIFIPLLCIGCLGIGFVLGYQARTVQQASNTDTWAPVHIVKNFGDNSFTAYVNNDPETTTFKLCKDSSYAQFESGSWLKFMTFERRDGCLSFAGSQLGFRSMWDENGKPIITEAKLNGR